MSGIILEPIEKDNAEPDSGLNEPVEGLAPIEESVVQPVPTTPIEEALVKRPRGRPKSSAKPKAKQVSSIPKPNSKLPPPPKLKRETTTRRVPQPAYSDSSSSEDDMVGRLMEDDMETQILQFLSARKKDQESKRRALWQNLASSGLRR